MPEEGWWLHPRLIRRLSEAEEFRQAQLVGITGWAITVGLNPFGMLHAQIFVDLPLKFCVRMNRVIHAITIGWDEPRAIARTRDFSLPLRG